MKKRLLFIYNPSAGRGRIRSKLSEIIDVFSSQNYEIVVYPTKKKLDAQAKVLECKDNNEYTRIVCSGGDGTLNEVVSAMMEYPKKIPVGYIPSGTTNDFGYSLKIPNDMVKAATIMAKANAMLCDVGQINEKYFVYTAAFGLFADVSYETPQNIKNVLGRMAYILSGVTKLHGVKSLHLRIENEDEVIEDEFIVGMVANSDSIGGFRGITGKEVELDDGLFELIMIRRPHNLIEIKEIINDLLKNDLSASYFYYRRIREVTIISETELPWSLDGEYGGTTHNAAIRIHKQVIPYICNRKATKEQ